MDGDPTHMSPHHLAHDDPVVGLGRGLQAVDRLGGDLDRRVEPEGHLGPGQVVVDGLGHADDREAQLVQSFRRAQCVISADGHHRIEPERLDGGLDTVGTIVSGERIGAGRSRGSCLPWSRWTGTDRRPSETVLFSMRPAPAVEEADELVAVMDDTTDHHGPDDRVQPRAVTTTGEHADSHPLMIGTM